MRELPAEALPCLLDTPSDAILFALDTRGARGGRGGALSVASGLHLVDEVAGSATADVVDRGLLGAQTLLLLELLIEAEDGAFRLPHVAGTATASSVSGIGWWRRQFGAGCWARGSWAGGDFSRLDTHGVASTAAARIHVVGGGWVWLVDAEVDHFGGGVCGLREGWTNQAK